MGAPVVTARDLSYAYPQPFGARGTPFRLEAINVDLHAGSVTAVIGPNGSGKSTFLKLLSTVLRPKAGNLKIFGEDAVTGRWRIRRRIGYLPQRPRLDSAMTVECITRLALMLRGLGGREARALGLELLELFGLHLLKHKRVGQLSGGQYQRAGLATVLGGQPDLLLLDEPMAGLDKDGRESFLAFLTGLAEGGMTIVVASHHHEDILGIADQVLEFDEGRITGDAKCGV